jgi:DNA-binding NarL/FixJ family response regulator
MQKRIRILIADDHAVVRQGLKQLLEEGPGMKIVAEHANGASALDWLRSHACDIALIDIAMPGMNGIELLKQLYREQPDLPVLILSTYAESQYAVRLIKAGASGYLTKECAPMEIVEAVQCLASGKKYFSQAVIKMLAKEVSAVKEEFPHEALSEREYQIFLMLSSAQTVTDIAQKLGLSVKTVSTFRSRVLEKMHLRNNSELMRYASENNLLQHSSPDVQHRNGKS